ncbi:TetR family transcriptional regulator [Rhodococcus sp. ACT016]|uniref:TetR family transcriptional regulator n=1 Tax=Rhodococcus sp. ACT016 TaxID=3134808 RepID=UPI003D2C4559
MEAEIPAKERLLRAGEYLFAREGIDRTRLSDINRIAEVRNDSAIHYYFGSREGLLEAIIVSHFVDVNSRMAELVDRLCTGREPSPQALRDAIAAQAIPLGEKLRDERGRDFMQILAEVYDRRGGITEGQYASASTEARNLVRQCLTGMTDALREERMRLMANFIVSALAARARACDDEAELPLDHDAFVANLIEMTTAAVAARPPSSVSPLPNHALDVE